MNRELVEHFKSRMSKNLAEYVEHEWYDGLRSSEDGGTTIIGGLPSGESFKDMKDKIQRGSRQIRRGFGTILRNIRLPNLRGLGSRGLGALGGSGLGIP